MGPADLQDSFCLPTGEVGQDVGAHLYMCWHTVCGRARGGRSQHGVLLLRAATYFIFLRREPHWDLGPVNSSDPPVSNSTALHKTKCGLHTCNFSTWEVEARESEV